MLSRFVMTSHSVAAHATIRAALHSCGTMDDAQFAGAVSKGRKHGVD